MSFPRRHAATQRFTLGAPRTVAVSKDGARVIFARSDAGDDPVNKLWVLDTSSGEERLIADPVELLAGASTELTDAELARRERAREAGGGIVSYTLNADATAALFVLGGRLFSANLIDGGATEVPLDAAVTGSVFDARYSPAGDLIGFVSGTELYVANSDGSDLRRLSPAEEDSALVSWGSAEFVAAEEMGRGRGWWWAPDGTAVLAARVDTKPVPEWWISSPVAPWQAPRAHRYPAAGTTNATVDLSILGLNGSVVAVDWRGAEFEYLAAASWSKAHGITLVVQTRDQRTLAVVHVDPTTGATSELQRVTDEVFIELMAGVPSWSGERLVTAVNHDDTVMLAVDGEVVGTPGLQIRSVVSVNAERAIVTATTEPTELHVARIDLSTGETEMLTSEPGVHRAATGGDQLVLISSSLDHFGSRTRLVDGPEITSHAETPTVAPNVSMIEAGPDRIRCAVLLPANHDGTPLPVLMDPYGGPHALRNQKARNLFLTSQWFADQGFCVIVADGRGTPARGVAWERSVYGDLAQPVLDDQVTALQAVADQFPVDLDKVAIRGWSFGGYLAALAVLRRPDVFHAAVAGAPVTDWKLYDTHYTERYLGHPDDVPEHYAQSDLCADAHRLERPLLLIHGLADDNVVAAHTLSLSQALLEAGRPHEVLPLSGVTHMTPQEAVAENLLNLQLAFINRSLGLGPVA